MTLPVGSITGTLRLLGASEFDAGIVGAQRSMDLAAGAASKMAGAVNESEAAMTRNAAQAAKLRALSLSLTAAEERHTTAVMSGNASTAKLAATEAAELRARVRLAEATDASTRSVAAMGKTSATAAAEVSTFRTGLASTVETAGKLGLAFGAFELIKKGIDIGKQSADFQRQMLLIQTVANASASEVTNMTSALLGMSGQVATGPDQLALSLYHVEQNGLRGGQALEVVKTAAEGAKVGMADVESTTNSMTSAVASGIKGVQNMDQAMGALLATAGTGDMKMSDLNDALSNGILTVAKTYGLSLKDVGASLAVFGDLNMRGTDAASQLRQAIMAFAKPAVGTAAAAMLDKLGMSTKTLAVDMQHGGLNQAVTDLRNRLTAAGITGDQVGKALLDLFGKKAGIGVSTLVDQYDRLQRKYAELDAGAQSFGDKWAETKKTAGFALDQLGAEAQAAGIKLAQKLLPAGTDAAKLLGAALPAAINLGHDALVPFVAGWKALDAVLVPTAHAAADVARDLGPVAPVLKDTAAAALTMWLAWRGYRIVVAAGSAIKSVAETGYLKTLMMRDGIVSSAGPIQASYGRIGASAEVAGLQQKASADEAAAAQARSAAVTAQSFADETAASKAATDQQVADADARATAALAAARSAQIAATESSAAAEEASVAIVASGDAARFGWASLAGPIGIAAAGVLTFATMLHHSGQSAEESAAQVQTYTDAIKSDSGALANNTREAVRNALEQSGAAAAGEKLGISYKLITDAVLGVPGALKQVNAQLLPYSYGVFGATKNTHDQVAAAKLLSSMLGDQSSEVRKAADLYNYETGKTKDNTSATDKNSNSKKQQNMVLGWLVTSHGNLVQAEHKSGSALADGTKAMQAQTVASTLLKNALDVLNGVNENVEQSTDSFNIALLQLKNGSALAKDANGDFVRSLSRSSVAGNQNRQTLVSLIDAAKTQAQAIADSTAKRKGETAGLLAGNKALQANEDRIRAAAQAAGLDKKQVDALIKSIGQLSRVHAAPKVSLDTSDAYRQLANLQASINSLGGSSPSIANALGHAKHNTHAAGGLIHGPGTGTSDSVPAWLSTGEFVVNAAATAANLPLLRAMNAERKAAGGQVGKTVSTVVSRSGSHGLAGRLLFQEGDMIGRELIAGLQMHKGDLIATAGSVVDAMVKSLGHARSLVLSSIHKATAPDKGSSDSLSAIITGHEHTATDVIKNPGAVAALIGAPTAAATAAATRAQQRADIALANYRRLAAEARDVTKATNAHVAASEHEAHQADIAARKAKNHAEDMASSTKAERAAKSAAEDHARTLARVATRADNTAQRVSKAAQKQQGAAQSLADKGKAAYQKYAAAAKAASQVAQQDAQNMVASIAAQFAALQQDYDNMKSTISGGLTSGSDLSTIWGKLGDDVQTASDNLDQANQALQSAQDAVQQATPDTEALTRAQNAAAAAAASLASARQAVVAAQAAGNTDQVIAAQNALTAAMTASSNANAAVVQAQSDLAQQSGPTADQLKAVADAQAKVTDAQKAYTAAKAADSASGVASVLAGFAGSEKQFSDDLTHLKSMIGTGPAAQSLITELAGLGAQSGDALAEGLINDPASLKAILASMQQIQSIADNEGTQLATAFYQAGANSLMQLMQGIEDEFPSVAAALAPYAAQLAQMFNIPMPTPPADSGSTAAGAGTPSSSAAGAGKSVTNASDIGSYYLVRDKANGKWYDVNPTAKTVHELTDAQRQRDIAAGATINTRHSGVPHFADGGVMAASGLAWVGELGPELVRLPGGSKVTPTNRVKDAFDQSAVVAELRSLNARVDRMAAKLDPLAHVPDIARVGARALQDSNSLHGALGLAAQ